MSRPTRADQAIDLIQDIDGEDWLVREYRPTRHGFDVAIGWPAEALQQGAATILTTRLAVYLMVEVRPRDIDLPIGRTTIKRLRAELDLRFDWDDWWAAREGDLRSMTLEAFAARHNCSVGAASQRRAKLLKAPPSGESGA